MTDDPGMFHDYWRSLAGLMTATAVLSWAVWRLGEWWRTRQ